MQRCSSIVTRQLSCFARAGTCRKRLLIREVVTQMRSSMQRLHIVDAPARRVSCVLFRNRPPARVKLRLLLRDAARNGLRYLTTRTGAGHKEPRRAAVRRRAHKCLRAGRRRSGHCKPEQRRGLCCLTTASLHPCTCVRSAFATATVRRAASRAAPVHHVRPGSSRACRRRLQWRERLQLPAAACAEL